MKLKEQLKIFMEMNYLTLTMLSEKSGVSKSTLSGWMNGSIPRDIRKLKEVAHALEISVDRLCWGEEERVPPLQIKDFQEEIEIGQYEVILRKVKQSKEESL